jgi:hypothetical protein
MNADEPRVRRRGYFLSESGSDPDVLEAESAEGIDTFRVTRPRRARKVVVAAAGSRPRRHRAALSSHVSRTGEKKAGATSRSENVTGSHRP